MSTRKNQATTAQKSTYALVRITLLSYQAIPNLHILLEIKIGSLYTVEVVPYFSEMLVKNVTRCRGNTTNPTNFINGTVPLILEMTRLCIKSWKTLTQESCDNGNNIMNRIIDETIIIIINIQMKFLVCNLYSHTQVRSTEKAQPSRVYNKWGAGGGGT